MRNRASIRLGLATALAPSITECSLRALLRSPHETMPHITFTYDEMDDIVGYIVSLKPRN